MDVNESLDCGVLGGRDVGVGKKRRHYTYVSEEEIREAFEDWKKETSSSTLDQELENANHWAAMHGIETPPFPRKRRRLQRTLPVRKEAEERTSRRRFRPVVQLASVLIILVMGGWYMQTDPVRGARVGIMDLLVGQYRDKYIFQMEHSSQNEDWKELRPGYIPEGFELVGEEESQDMVLLSYSKEELFVDIMITITEELVMYGEGSNQTYDYAYISDGNLVTIYKQNDVYTLIWMMDDTYLIMTGNISEEVLFDVAESIDIMEKIE